MSGGELVRTDDDLLEEVAELMEVTPRLPLPFTGEVVELADPVSVAGGLVQLDELQAQLEDARRLLTLLLRAESARQGTQTLHLGDLTVTLSTASRPVYEPAELHAALEAAGLPADRLNAAVWQYVAWRVDGRVLRELEAANPVYAAIIKTHRRREPQPVRAKVKR